MVSIEVSDCNGVFAEELTDGWCVASFTARGRGNVDVVDGDVVIPSEDLNTLGLQVFISSGDVRFDVPEPYTILYDETKASTFASGRVPVFRN